MALIDIIKDMDEPDRMRIHAIELKMVDQSGRQIELQTFECGLIVPLHRNFGYCYGAMAQAFPITIHTSKGDINGEIGRF